MFELKPLSIEAVPAALAKVERYRLLNEPSQAESICLDILRVNPEHQEATVMLILALTDQFAQRPQAVEEARSALQKLRDPYQSAYYTGIVWERLANAQFDRKSPGARFNAYGSFREAMTWYEKAEAVRPHGNDDALLRWNTCARILMRHPELQRVEEPAEPILSE
jgi:tetratricopeptide (TPR) repeat protein